MLDSIHIRGFKSIEDQKLELGRFNVVVGANGSGKTNLLEAIGLLGCAAAGRVDDEAFRRRGVRPGVPALYKSAFRARKAIPRLIRLEARSADASYRVALDNPIDRPQPAWRIANESVDAHDQALGSRGPGGARLKIDGRMKSTVIDSRSSIASLVRAVQGNDTDPVSRLIDGLTGFGIYTPFTPMLRGTEPDPTAARPLGLAGGGLAEAMKSALSSESGKRGVALALSLIDWAKSIGVSSPAEAQLSPSVATKRSVVRFRDRHMVDKRNWLSAFDASEGALYVLFLSILACHPDSPPVAAVDNVDQGLNPRLARALIERVQHEILEDDQRPQLVLTAHNPLVLDALRLIDNRVRLFVVQRARTGETVVRRLAWNDALHRASKEGMSLSQLWLSGALGGMPNL